MDKTKTVSAFVQMGGEDGGSSKEIMGRGSSKKIMGRGSSKGIMGGGSSK